jgi:hypothetical protein
MNFVNWDDARGATGYRLVAQVAAGNALAEHLTQASESALNGNLPVGTQLNIIITARDAPGGESQPAAPVAATVP